MARCIDPSLCDIDFAELQLNSSPFSDGAYSKVFKAEYQGDVVCAKLIPKDLDVDDPLFSLYVEREVAISKELDHPNIVKFHGAGQDEVYYYLLTEFVPGGNMRSFIKRQRGLSWDLKLHIAIGIAQGLKYMHSKNILHRDIKSENFLVGENWQIKICDFGFAKVVNGDITKKAAHSICGTEEYMAPEMLMGLDYNDKVDIFSYGIFLAELFTQCYLPTDLVRTPATQFGLSDIVFKELLPPDCPSLLADLVVECCSYVISNRPSLEKLIHKLEDIKEVLPKFQSHGNPRPHDPPESMRRRNKRNYYTPKEETITMTVFEAGPIEFEEMNLEDTDLPNEEMNVNLQMDDLQLHELQPMELQETEFDEEEEEQEEIEEIDKEGEEREEGEEKEDEERGKIVHKYHEEELQMDVLEQNEEERQIEEEEIEDREIEEEGEAIGEVDLSQELEEIEETEELEEKQQIEEDIFDEDDEDFDELKAQSFRLTHAKEREEETEFEIQEFQYSVVQETTEVETQEERERQQTQKGNRPMLGQTTTPRHQRPSLQHWESRELLENPLEREFRLSMHFMKEVKLPTVDKEREREREIKREREEIPQEEVGEMKEIAEESWKDERKEEENNEEEEYREDNNQEEEEEYREYEDDREYREEDTEEEYREEEEDYEFDLKMESFIVVDYPSVEEEPREITFNFDEMYISKSSKYSVYYH